MYDKYKQLEKVLKNLVIRAKEGKFTQDGEEKDAIIVDISGEMKLKDLQINDMSLLDPTQKKHLEELLVTAFQKAQNKAQEIVAEKTKEILGVDTNDLAGMIGGGGIP
ncbi:MAG: YbaB/EbfC family nucleoid-associated protein [Candidatus Peribacteria bacterium]|nr:YbaB/EbfC family nucleoid-associated protein [Candidatus Peribacteria bacterium]